MYEDKKKEKLKIDWKSLIIKLVLLLVVVFLILWVVSLVKKRNKPIVVESNIEENLQAMKDGSLKYFVKETLPSDVNGKKKVTLEALISEGLVSELKTLDGEACSLTNSYAQATKISEEEYAIKIKVVCGNDSKYIIENVVIAVENYEEDKSNQEENKDKEDNSSNNSTSNTTTNNTTSNTTNNSTSNTTSSNNTSTTKPTTNNSTSNNIINNTTTKPSTNNTTTNSTNNNTTSNNTTNNATSNTTTKPDTSTTDTCQYGSLDYISNYPLAYKVTGCAVSKEVLYQATHANAVNSLGVAEYQKIVNEISDLAKKTGANLYVEAPVFTPVINKTGTGYVGYQVYFVVKEKQTYTAKTIYSYYLSENGIRVAVIDDRSTLNK